ncbi:MAG: type II toxin-antitoxin system HicA family toxin [Actinobacteria bacterium]|nr:type II toxin-antitoxin system HicA family toxin [Actinomycetota bacterium]
MKIREIIRIIKKDGWFMVSQKGSHRQFKHHAKPGRVTIAGNPGDDISAGTLNSVLKQAGIKQEGE